MKEFNKTEFFQQCSTLGAAIIGTSVGIYFYSYFVGTELWLIILGVTVYNTGSIGIYLIKDAAEKNAIRPIYFSRLIVWLCFAIILLVFGWLINFDFRE